MDPSDVKLAKQLFTDAEMRIRFYCFDHRVGQGYRRGCMEWLSIGGRWGCGEGAIDDGDDGGEY